MGGSLAGKFARTAYFLLCILHVKMCCIIAIRHFFLFVLHWRGFLPVMFWIIESHCRVNDALRNAFVEKMWWRKFNGNSNIRHFISIFRSKETSSEFLSAISWRAFYKQSKAHTKCLLSPHEKRHSELLENWMHLSLCRLNYSTSNPHPHLPHPFLFYNR